MPFKWDKGKSGKLSVFPVLTYAEPGYVLLKQDKYALMGIYGRKTGIEYFILWILQFRIIHIVKNVEFQIGWQQLCWQSDLWGL